MYFRTKYLNDTGCIKKATEIVFIWEDREDFSVRFEYKTTSEGYTVAEILAKRFGASIFS